MFLPLLVALPALAQRPVEFEKRPGLALENDKLSLTVLTDGGAFASLLLRDDPERMNPMWEPIRMAREDGAAPGFGFSMGHFVCVDGFGPVSPEEQAAGLPGHGEAHRQKYEILSSGRSGPRIQVVMRAQLPLVQETFTRTIELADGENVVAVTSELESLLAFDRPVNWAEHATIGSPFLAPEATVVDLSAGPCQTRFHAARRNAPVPHRLSDSKPFSWPMAPTVDGGTINLRTAPKTPMMDHTTCAMDPNRRLAWVTALHLEKRLLVGYLFRRAEFPWTQNWLHYPPNGKMARGLEFSTQPFDVPRRQAVETASLFRVPAYRWLPAKSKIGGRFLMFYTRTPEGMRRVDEVTLEGSRLVIEDRASGKRVELATTQSL